MLKIKDKMLLGIVAGLGANTVKLTLNTIFKELKWIEMGSTERALGIFLPSHTLTQKKGRIIGYLADSTVASLLGVIFTYVLSKTGKNKAVLKGSIFGQSSWALLYGVLGTLGATKISPGSPNTVLAEFISHTAFGATSTYLITKFGDSGQNNATGTLGQANLNDSILESASS
ncbi:MAG: hypothetical protein Q8912_09775 [Bacillota bacterium]|nr:hypothetical protein [Bacillota bacterium]